MKKRASLKRTQQKAAKKAAKKAANRGMKNPPQSKVHRPATAPATATSFTSEALETEMDRLGMFCNQRQYAQAEQLGLDMIRRHPENGQIWKALGIAFQNLGKLEESLQAKQKAVELLPNDPGALSNLGNTYQNMERLQEAERCLTRAIEMAPDFFMAHNNLGLTFEKQERFEEAEIHYQKALELRPDYVVAHYNYGNTLQKQKKIEEAAKSYRKALSLQPNYKEALNNYGGILHKLEDFHGAVECYRKVLSLDPNTPDAYTNLGLSLEKLDRFQESEQAYLRALSYKPQDPETHNNYGLLLLITGHWEKAWKEHQWFYHPDNTNTASPVPPKVPANAKIWEGEPLQDKTILIYREQGLGDMIQFVRYSELLKAQGATVHISVAKPLIEICKTIPWVDGVLTNEEILETHLDYWVFPLQLPYWFHSTVENLPVTVPYLSVDAQKSAWWKIWLDKQIPAHHKRIGLVWAGNPKQPNDKKRSLALSQFADFANLPDITFVSLQLGEKAENELKNAPEGLNILDGGRFIEDFTDSAGLLDNLDLLITVCSAPAHLAGALNVPVWTIISKPFDWRWLLNRNDSVWYKSMRLFRQTTNGDWSPVLENVKNELLTLRKDG